MKIAYLILAHNNPQQLKRLVGRLCADNAPIFIHLDKKTQDRQSFYNEINGLKNSRFIEKNTSVNWGGFSVVQAILNSLWEIIACGADFDYISLMSGSDYPIKTAASIEEFFIHNSGQEFIHYRQVSDNVHYEGRIDRIWYYYDFDNIYGAYGKKGCQSYELEMRRRGIRRSFMEGITPYQGSTWWSLSKLCIIHILKLIEENLDLINFYRYTKFADEQFFQTLVLNSPFAANVFSENIWYVDWSDALKPHPKTLCVNDFTALKNSSCLYARKFDMKRDSAIIELLDGLR